VSSVYGDMLAFFPELIEDHTTFTMSPVVVGGYGPRQNIRGARGILQYIKAGDVSFIEGLAAETEYPVFWTRVILDKDAYVEEKDGTMYKRTKSNQWKKIGGFNMYVLEMVIGVNGKQETDTAVDLGKRFYD
jgi:hypothetical protein